MTDTADIDRTAFAALPQPSNLEGRPRRTGVEIEFAGLTEHEAADIAARVLGGEVTAHDDHALEVTGSQAGDLTVYLDTRYRDLDGPLARAGLDLARSVVPVEIVTRPLTPEQLPLLDDLRDALRQAGAKGSHQGWLFGFGLHLNPEIPGPDARQLAPILTAYALLEDWLRLADPMDASRRLLPFANPYPPDFVDALVARTTWDRDALVDCYLQHNPTRNRGLDMLPALACLDESRVAGALGGLGAVSARPAFHYRLPDSRIDAADWTIAYEWNRWVLVESIARESALMSRLAEDWQDHRARPLRGRPAWSAQVAERLCAGKRAA